jgi:hypothetical protein
MASPSQAVDVDVPQFEKKRKADSPPAPTAATEEIVVKKGMLREARYAGPFLFG